MNLSGRIHPLDLLLAGLFVLATLRLGVPLLENTKTENAITSLIRTVETAEASSSNRNDSTLSLRRETINGVPIISSSISLPGINSYQVVQAHDTKAEISVEIYSVGEKKVKLIMADGGSSE